MYVGFFVVLFFFLVTMKDTRLTALETDVPTVLRTGKVHI